MGIASRVSAAPPARSGSSGKSRHKEGQRVNLQHVRSAADTAALCARFRQKGGGGHLVPPTIQPFPSGDKNLSSLLSAPRSGDKKLSQRVSPGETNFLTSRNICPPGTQISWHRQKVVSPGDKSFDANLSPEETNSAREDKSCLQMRQIFR
jgi:hypothetical protein